MEYQLPNHLFSSNANAKRIVTNYIDHLTEVVYDITLNAQYGIDHHKYECEDSRALKSSIVEWAIEFIAHEPNRGENDDDDTFDYINAVDEYANAKLTERYGVFIDFMLEFNGANFRVSARTFDEAKEVLASQVIKTATIVITSAPR